jgi:hypothetical protein
VGISQNFVVFSEYMNFKYFYKTLCINGRVAANRQMNKGKVQEFDEFKLEIISNSVETFSLKTVT